jgi:hypothetical protein
MPMMHTTARDAILYTTSRKYHETFRQFLWWAGFVHNLKHSAAFSTATEPAFSVFERNFFMCENQMRYIYEYSTVVRIDSAKAEIRCVC